MGPRTVLVSLVATLALSAPAYAQGDPPAALFESAPAEQAGAATPTDGGRNALLLALAGVAVAGAGVAGATALRRRRVTPAVAEPLSIAAEHVPAERVPLEAAPVAEEAAPETWRPRVVSEVQPLPAFGSKEPPAS